MTQAQPPFPTARTEPEQGAGAIAHFENLVRWRRDIRHFKTDPVPRESIEACLKLANCAPSVGLSQPWRFVELESQHRRDQIIASFERCNTNALNNYEGEKKKLYATLKLEGLKQAPIQLAVFCDKTTSQGAGLGKATMPEMLCYSVVTAVHTFWLAARTHGLGVGWVSILEPETVAEACDIEKDWKLVAYLCVGWPAKDPNATPELERCGWEQRHVMGDFYKKL